MTHGKQLWCEDDMLLHDPDRERIGQAWQRLFGEPFPESMVERKRVAVEHEDAGDSFWYKMPNGAVACHSCDGWVIYEGVL